MDETEYADVDIDKVDEADAVWALEINRKITYFCITPIAVTGIVLNIIVIFTWRKCSSSYHSAIFLFKVLAVADITYMGGFCLWYYSDSESIHKLIFRGLAFSARNMLVNIILLMTIVRWIAVKFPFRFRALSSAFRIRIALAIIFAYCTVVEIVDILMSKFNVPKPLQKNVNITLDQINLSLPLIAQFALSISIVWLTGKVQRKVKSGWITSSVSVIKRPSFFKRRMSAKLAYGRNRRLNVIIISISLLTFLAYPVGITLITYFKLAPAPPKASFKKIVFACINLLHVINSTVGFFIYYTFMPEFRKNFQETFCYWQKRHSPEQDLRQNRKTTMTTDIEYPRDSVNPSLAGTFNTSPSDFVQELC